MSCDGASTWRDCAGGLGRTFWVVMNEGEVGAAAHPSPDRLPFNQLAYLSAAFAFAWEWVSVVHLMVVNLGECVESQEM